MKVKAPPRHRPCITSRPVGASPASKHAVCRGSWTPDEDALLASVVAVHGACNWSTIARLMGTRRLPKQCRERWNQALNPGYNRGPWTPGEDEAILDGYHEYGGKWASIAQTLDGRLDHAVKNRFFALTRVRAPRRARLGPKPKAASKSRGEPRPKPKAKPKPKQVDATRAPLAQIQCEELACDEALEQLVKGNPAHTLKDPKLLPQRAMTSHMSRVVVLSSPTGCRGLALGGHSPFKAINAMLRGSYDASKDAWDGLPRVYEPIA